MRTVTCGLLVAITSAAAAAQQPGADGPSKALEGRWTLELYLDTPSARFSPMAGQINGEVAFSNTAWWNPRDRFGRHSLDLQSFFGRSFLRQAGTVAFGPGDTSMVTEVSGNVRGDSVNIDFIPRVDHGGISMWGRFYGDSAKGKWDRRGADGDGHFVLRRVSKEAVSVAAIPMGVRLSSLQLRRSRLQRPSCAPRQRLMRWRRPRPRIACVQRRGPKHWQRQSGGQCAQGRPGRSARQVESRFCRECRGARFGARRRRCRDTGEKGLHRYRCRSD